MKGITMKIRTLNKAILKGTALLVNHKILRARYRILNKQNDLFGITYKRDVRHIKLCRDLKLSRLTMSIHTAYMKALIAKWNAEHDK